MSTVKEGLIYTNDNCVGCNKCIKSCGSMGACISPLEDEYGRSRVIVDGNRCVACGACFDACEHNAREYLDDTEAFFDALRAGEQISLLIAPSFQANYPDEFSNVLGALKAMGVNRLINVAFGADISTWGYIKLITEQGFTGGISQPCPAVVGYIEKYIPELIPSLYPMQSPLMCAAIYARKELGITDRFAFISPCIAKKMEISDPDNPDYIAYNVTFTHLMEYIKTHNITGTPCTDEIDYGLGAIYPMPGGLKDYVNWLMGDKAFIRQIEGEKRMYKYLKKHASAIASHAAPFLFIDALNCENGCLCGTAIDPERNGSDDALFTLLGIRENIKTDKDDSFLSRNLSCEERLALFNEHFSNLNINDYLRTYTDRSASCAYKIPDDAAIDDIFNHMGKFTDEQRHINCTACGYDNCRDMAIAIYNGFNHRDNCVHFLKDTVEKEKEELRYYASYDTALGIWNRRYAVSHLNEILSPEDSFTMVMTDINDFKGINMTYGTEVADILLKDTAHALKELADEGGWHVARYGGDEFLIVLPSKDITAKSPEIRQIEEVFGLPFFVDGKVMHATVSMGISSSDGVTPVLQHINNAESAMFDAKNSSNTHAFLYSDELREKANEEERIKSLLTDALDNDGFFMLYQPKVDVKTKATVSYEALVRMKAPGMYPGVFIPVAERNGLIWRIGRKTTELVIKQLAQWRDQGYELRPVSINFSSVQINDEGYLDYLLDLLRTYNISTKYVELEITEGILMEKTIQAIKLLNLFQAVGIRLHMDDFGTGYSSLGYLTYVPVDAVKLDKSLVDNYLVEGKDAFINDVIRLIHDLDKIMIIEGVEEEWQYERLHQFGADIIQGYYFSKPIPPEEAIVFSAVK